MEPSMPMARRHLMVSAGFLRLQTAQKRLLYFSQLFSQPMDVDDDSLPMDVDEAFELLGNYFSNIQTPDVDSLCDSFSCISLNTDAMDWDDSVPMEVASAIDLLIEYFSSLTF